MKRTFLKSLFLALLLLASPAHAQLRGLPDGGAAEFRQKQMQEYAETDRQEKWMWVVGVLVVGGIAAYLWSEHQKEQRKK